MTVQRKRVHFVRCTVSFYLSTSVLCICMCLCVCVGCVFSLSVCWSWCWCCCCCARRRSHDRSLPLQIRVDGIPPAARSALLYETVTVVEGSPILRDMVFSPDYQYIYLLSDKQVSAADRYDWANAVRVSQTFGSVRRNGVGMLDCSTG